MIACPQCATFNVDEARFCEQCGNDLVATAAAPEGSTRILTVGRDFENDVVLDLPMVSSRHALVTIDEHRIVVQDLKTTNGTWLNSMEQRLTAATEVTASDVLYFGSYRVTVKRLLAHADGDHQKDILYKVENEPITLGRGPECDVILDHPLISARHAQLLPVEEGTLIQRPNEGGKIRVNGQLVDQHLLEPGDKVMLGPFLLRYTSKGLLQTRSWRQITLDLRDVSVVLHKNNKAKRKTLIDRISAVVYPGEIVALMGIAGAGKSTLIKAANGHLRPEFGHVYYNDLDLYEHYDTFRHAIGYVPQEDIFHKDLTVVQALTYAARLRLGPDYGASGITLRVDEVLHQLKMFDSNPGIRNVRLSQISGGQKRRLNIAIELLADPALFFLDEPLSGLSSEDALVVMGLLRQLAEQGKTIVMSVHQPSPQIYAMLDNVIYLHKGGRLVYYGPTMPDSLTFTNPHLTPADAKDPDLALRALDTESVTWWQRKYQESDYHREFVLARKRKLDHQQWENQETTEHSLISRFAQWRILLDRNVRIKLNDTLNTLILLLQSPVIAALIALVFGGPADTSYESAPTTLYLCVISAIWFGCSNSARDICGEWPIYGRERMYNLGILPYYFAKLTTGCLIGLIQCVLLVWIVARFCHFHAPLDQMIWRLWLTCSAGVCLGLLVSAFASPFKKSNEIAVGLIPIVLLPMVIMGGIIKPYKDMNLAAQLVANTTVTRWAFESTLALEANHNHEVVMFELPGGLTEERHQKDLMREPFFEVGETHSLIGMAIILLMCLVLMNLTMVYLRARDKI